MMAAAIGVVSTAGVAGYVMALSTSPAVATIAGVGVAASMVSFLLRRGALAAPALLGLSYLAAVASKDGIDLAAPLVAAGLFLLHEALDAVSTTDAVSVVSRSVGAGRALWLLVMLAAGWVTGSLAMWVGGASRLRGPVAFGLAAVVGLTILIIPAIIALRALDRRGPVRP